MAYHTRLQTTTDKCEHASVDIYGNIDVSCEDKVASYVMHYYNLFIQLDTLMTSQGSDTVTSIFKCYSSNTSKVYVYFS